MENKMINQSKDIILSGKGKYFLDLLSTNINIERNIEDAILLFGVPRGGTTWFLNILSTINNYKPIHEPFNKNWFPIKNIHIGGRPYIFSKESNNTLEDYLNKVFLGQIPSFNPACNLNNCFSKKILVKFIRANRLMPWISNHFKVRSMFLIIRHPCAVISSQIESGIRGYFTKKEILLSKDMVISDFLKIPLVKNNKKLMNKLNKINTQEELLAAIWSIDTLIPLSVPNPKPWNIVVYEQLVLKWEDELKKIFCSLNETIPKNAYEKFLVPSRTTQDASYLGTSKQLVKWEKKLSEKQIEQILNVIEWFNIDFYGRDAEPDYYKLKNWQSDSINL